MSQPAEDFARNLGQTSQLLGTAEHCLQRAARTALHAAADSPSFDPPARAQSEAATTPARPAGLSRAKAAAELVHLAKRIRKLAEQFGGEVAS